MQITKKYSKRNGKNKQTMLNGGGFPKLFKTKGPKAPKEPKAVKGNKYKELGVLLAEQSPRTGRTWASMVNVNPKGRGTFKSGTVPEQLKKHPLIQKLASTGKLSKALGRALPIATNFVDATAKMRENYKTSQQQGPQQPESPLKRRGAIRRPSESPYMTVLPKFTPQGLGQAAAQTVYRLRNEFKNNAATRTKRGIRYDTNKIRERLEQEGHDRKTAMSIAKQISRSSTGITGVAESFGVIPKSVQRVGVSTTSQMVANAAGAAARTSVKREREMARLITGQGTAPKTPTEAARIVSAREQARKAMQQFNKTIGQNGLSKNFGQGSSN